MTYTAVRYENYEEYLASDLGLEGNFRLLSSGEVIELPPEDRENDFIANEIGEIIRRLVGNRRLVSWATEIQVHPVGDSHVNRRPDLTVLRPEHIELTNELGKNAILLGMPAPVLVVELISPGREWSANYRRDYEWKKQQYEWWAIPEYWIVDRHRKQVAVFRLVEGSYEAHSYRDSDRVQPAVFPSISLSAKQILEGNIV